MQQALRVPDELFDPSPHKSNVPFASDAVKDQLVQLAAHLSAPSATAEEDGPEDDDHAPPEGSRRALAPIHRTPYAGPPAAVRCVERARRRRPAADGSTPAEEEMAPPGACALLTSAEPPRSARGHKAAPVLHDAIPPPPALPPTHADGGGAHGYANGYANGHANGYANGAARYLNA